MQFATGAMSSLLPKLGELLVEEYKLKKSVRKGIEELKAELESMQAALIKVSSVPLDQLDPQVKIWANEVRELSYAIEDSLDSFVTRVEGNEPTKPKIKHLLKKARNEFSKFKARHEIANDIKDIQSQVRKIKERRDSYKIDDVDANPAATTVDPRLPALYKKLSDLVGIDKPINELIKILSEGVPMPDKNPKIVSIVGFGGLGKTTLAKALYDKLSTKYQRVTTYQCHGFVPVGQNPKAKKVLLDIVCELDKELYKAATTMDERQLINELQTFLAGKRYFIVIDDIWDTQIWETIKCAFMDSHPESRLIITTRIVDVATKAGGIYHMQPLSDDYSKILFYTRTSGSEGPAEVTTKILKKCGGVPLAITTIASLLVGKHTEDWSKVYDAIGFGHADNGDVHNTRKILSFSYYDLSSNLKTCLLYLSVFPEDYLINKISLIWRWVAEGFIPYGEGMEPFELGEIYFNKLVNKSMIRWIDPEDNDGRGGCRVHDMVLDLIRTISNDVNFVTIHDMEQHGTCSRGERTNWVRRLAVHGSGEHNSGIEMEHVRSYNVVDCRANSMPLLLSFKVLRVLVIEDCVLSEGSSLEHLGKLVQLRYLGLVKTAVKIPEGIGHDLKFLEILDVRGGLISELPPSVGELMNLRCLWADEGTVMKGEIGKLTCLEELELYSVHKCPNFFTEVGKLTELRVLHIHFAEIEESAGKALMESLRNLHKIHILRVWDDDGEAEYSVVLNDSLEDLAPCTKLYELILPIIVIPRVPSWINHLSVPLLSRLGLHVDAVEVQDVQTIGRLPSLLVLLLWSKDEKNISYTFGSNEFHKLRVLWTKKIEIAVGEGALPMLEVLEYRASAERKDAASLVPWRRNSCPLLKEVTCYLDCTNCSYRKVEEAEEALRQASGTRPNAVYLDLEIVKENYDKKAGKFIDNLEWILRGLDRPEDVGRPAAYQEERTRLMIRSLERRLRDDAEPRVGWHGEQEMRGLVTKFKIWLHDHAGTNQDEAGKSDATDSEDGDDEDYYYGDQAEADDGEATCSGDQQEEEGAQR
ncbi:disease resistance protein RGA5-like [Triticum aestivum]|uniref:disease resistance protein RGA5-like n=1 Tax=Triticum aestivum TaxID=4565 RepID=UPI001D01A074|nr:disease resistance protein RGA5-like [Triticum aestivum]XP_044407184.1 disease resistance protein RGA5-like [Triticum aestivum]